MLLTLGKAEGNDADLDIAGLDEFFSAGDDGGTRCDDIIDDEQMLATDGLTVDEFKHFLNILIALPTPFGRLATFEDVSPYHLAIYRKTRHLTDAPGNLQTLVITTLTLALPGQRNRYNSIDSIEEIASLQLLGHQPAHHLSDLRMILVFQLIDDISRLGMRLVIKESRSTFNGNLAPEQLSHLVVIGSLAEIRPRQVEIATGTNGLFCNSQPITADDTEPWGDQIEQAMPETNRFHRPYLLNNLPLPHPGIGG